MTIFLINYLLSFLITRLAILIAKHFTYGNLSEGEKISIKENYNFGEDKAAFIFFDLIVYMIPFIGELVMIKDIFVAILRSISKALIKVFDYYFP